MKANNQTKVRDITIHDLKPLTAKMLDSKIAGDITLNAFLEIQCNRLSESGSLHVYSTIHTSAFVHLKENRSINEAHVLALISSFETDGYLFTVVYVNEKLQIIDGQHRCEAARRKGLPVYFALMPGWGMKEVTILNVNSRNWTILDFMETHAKSGNPNYVRFRDFYEAHDFDITTCQLIVTGRRSGGYAATDSFRLGNMQIDEQQITDAYLKAKKLSCMQDFHPKGWKSRNFVKAMLLLFNTRGYDHDHLVQKFQTYPEVMLVGAKSLRVDEYIQVFLNKYNFRRLKDRIETVMQ